MRFAILPVEKEEYVEKQECFSSTRLAYFLGYLEQNFPEDIVYPWYDHEIIEKTYPDFIAIYIKDIEAYERAYYIAKDLSKLNIPIVMLGEVITYIPKLLPEFVTVGIIGEGEEQLKNLFGLVKKGITLEPKVLSRLQGLAFYSKGQIYINERMNYFNDIDSIKVTRRSFFGMPSIWYPSFYTGRGLPQKNSYESGFNTPVRLHSPERMMFDLIDILTFYSGANSIPVEDYLLLSDIKRFKTFCQMFKDASIEKYFRLEVKAKVYQLNEEIIHLIKETFKSQKIEIDFGILSPIVSKNLKIQYSEIQTHIEVLELCKKYSLSVTGNFLINLPQESKSDIAKVFWIIRNNHLKANPELKLKFEFAKLNIGSEIWFKSPIKKSFDDINKPSDILNTYNNLKKQMNLLNQSNDINEIQEIFLNIKTKPFKKKIHALQSLNIQQQNNYLMHYMAYQRTLEYLYSKDLLPDAVADILFRLFGTTNMKKPDISLEESSPMIKQILSSINWDALIGMSHLDRLIEEEKMNPAYIFKYGKREIPEYPSMLKILSEVLSKSKKLDMQLVFNAINEIKERFNNFNEKGYLEPILLSGKLLSIVAPDILENIIFNTKVKSILQVTDKTILDLNDILVNKEIDTIDSSNFNNSKFKPNFSKKYDCVVLFFTLDITTKNNKILQFCSRILNEHGMLIITSLNPKNIIFVSELLCEGDFSNILSTNNYNNPKSLDSLVNFTKNYNFIPINITNCSFPDKKFFNPTQKFVYNNLKSYDIRDEEVLVFAHTSVFRKKVKKLVL